MNGLYILIITFCLLNFISTTCQPEEENNKIRSSSDCVKRVFNDEEIAEQRFKCCYMKLKIKSNTEEGTRYECIALTQNDYNNVKSLTKQFKGDYGAEKVSIDCKSSNLKVMISLILILLFFKY